MDLLFDPYTILKFLHIVMAGLWLGMDMGVYTASGRLRCAVGEQCPEHRRPPCASPPHDANVHG